MSQETSTTPCFVIVIINAEDTAIGIVCDIEQTRGGKPQLVGNASNLLYQGLVSGIPLARQDPQAGTIDPVSRLAAGVCALETTMGLALHHVAGLSPRYQGVAIGIPLAVGNDPVGTPPPLGQEAGGDRELTWRGLLRVGAKAGTGRGRSAIAIRIASFGVIQDIDGVSPPGSFPPGGIRVVSNRVLGRHAAVAVQGRIGVHGLLLDEPGR